MPDTATGKSEESGNAESSAPSEARVEPLHIAFDDQPAALSPPVGKLRRGINLGNGFDAPTLGAWGVVPDEKHFAMAAAAGLDHVRLPVRFSAHADTSPPYTIDPLFFEKIDWAIDRALAHELSIIVDLHHYEELMTDPDAHADRFVALWRQIAERYRDRPKEVLFEILNEPNTNLTPNKWNPLLARTISTIRASNPERTIIVDSFFWAAASYLELLALPDDSHLVASFHMYQPILFTHQTAPWMGPEYDTANILFPGPPTEPVEPAAHAAQVPWVRKWIEDYNTQPRATNPSSPAAVAREFDTATRFVQARGLPVYLGEFGAIDTADPVSRQNYLRLVRREAERRGMAWAIWDDGGHNRAMDLRTGKWVEAVARGLFADQPGDALPDSIEVETLGH